MKTQFPHSVDVLPTVGFNSGFQNLNFIQSIHFHFSSHWKAFLIWLQSSVWRTTFILDYSKLQIDIPIVVVNLLLWGLRKRVREIHFGTQKYQFLMFCRLIQNRHTTLFYCTPKKCWRQKLTETNDTVGVWIFETAYDRLEKYGLNKDIWQR